MAEAISTENAETTEGLISDRLISARGHTDAALILTLAGLGWIILGLSALGAVPLGRLLIIAAVFAALLGGVLALKRRLAVFPPTVAPTEAERTLRRATAFEIVAIVVIVAAGAALHQQRFILPLVAVAVGLHFFPLARVLKRPLYYVTGAALCAVGVGVPLLVPAQWGTPAISGWLLTAGLSGGMILWLTTAALLWRGRALAQTLSVSASGAAPGVNA